MPIAHCYISPALKTPQHHQMDLIDEWARLSGISKENMTINLLSVEHQLGNAYAVIAHLQLPSMWSASSVIALQESLAQALALCLHQPLDSILVTTQIIDSGRVVENGASLTW